MQANWIRFGKVSSKPSTQRWRIVTNSDFTIGVGFSKPLSPGRSLLVQLVKLFSIQKTRLVPRALDATLLLRVKMHATPVVNLVSAVA